MPLVERNVGRIRRLEVGRHVVPIASPESILEECRAMALALLDRVDPDERQIPVGLAWMIAPNLLEDREHRRLPLGRYASPQHRRESLFVWLDTRREP
jgi:hypothetical protein